VPTATRTSKPPSLRLKKGRGVVTLTDPISKERKEFWLGPHGEPETLEAYHRLLAEWESNHRRLFRLSVRSTVREGHPEAPLSVTALVLRYWQWATKTYTASEVHTIRQALRVLRASYGDTPADEFGPNRLRVVRDAMVKGDANASPPRRPWSRSYVNKQVQRVVTVFRWAASHELLAESVHRQLSTVETLRRGRALPCGVVPAETDPVRAVEEDLVHAIRPHLSPQVEAIVLLQLHTGARGGELLGLRPKDISIDEKTGVWFSELAEHKTAHHGKRRTLFFGPQSQAVLEPFMHGRSPDAYLFSPREAEEARIASLTAARRTPRSCGNGVGTNRNAEAPRVLGDRYTADSYRRAITRACEKAFPPPDHVVAEGKSAVRAWRKAHAWHPHQLRHTAGTRIRREFGLEAAAATLGHSSAKLTDEVYAERDMQRVAEVMKRMG
jgi:integrase